MINEVPGRAHYEEEKVQIVEALLALWLKRPEQRLGQLLVNTLNNAGAPFFIEDDELLRLLKVAAR